MMILTENGIGIILNAQMPNEYSTSSYSLFLNVRLAFLCKLYSEIKTLLKRQ